MYLFVVYVFRLSPGTIGICTTPTVSRLTSVRAQLAGLSWRNPDLTGHIRRSDRVRACACARLSGSRVCVCCVCQSAFGFVSPCNRVCSSFARLCAACSIGCSVGWLVCFVVAWDDSNIMVLILFARLIDFLLFCIKGIWLDKKPSKNGKILIFLFFSKRFKTSYFESISELFGLKKL